MYDFETLYQDLYKALWDDIGEEPTHFTRSKYVTDCFVLGQDPDELTPEIQFVIDHALEQRKGDPQWPN